MTGRASVTRSADDRLSRSGPSPPKPPESLAPSTSRGNRHRSSTEPLPDDASADARPADVGRGCTPGRGDWPMRLMRHRLACRCYSTWRLPCGRMHNRPCSNINCGSGPTISRPRHRMSMSRVFGSGTSIVMAVQPSQGRAQTWHNSTMRDPGPTLGPPRTIQPHPLRSDGKSGQGQQRATSDGLELVREIPLGGGRWRIPQSWFGGADAGRKCVSIKRRI